MFSLDSQLNALTLELDTTAVSEQTSKTGCR